MVSTARNEFDDLVQRAKYHRIKPLTPGEKAGVLWAAGRIAELEKVAEALRPFAKFACDPPCECHNCRARAALAALSPKEGK